jgi:PAS domain S-box-containing protein
MHKLLERQLRKASAADGKVDVERLVREVNVAYEEADRARRIKDHAFEVMQREVEELNHRIRQEAEARFSIVMDNVGEAVITIDEIGVIESFNAAAVKIFGYSPEEVIGLNVKILMTEANAVHHDASLANYLRTGEAKIIGAAREAFALRKDGERFPIELGVGEVATGPRRHFIGVIRDISLRKRAEQQLRESEERFRDLAGSASDWFWESDGEHRLTFVSERIASVLGVKPAAVLGCTFLELGLADAASAVAHAEDLAARRPFRDRVFHVGPPEGHDSRVIRISGIPMFGGADEFLGYRGVGVDISREVAAERRARQAQQLLADAIERIVDGLAIYDANDRLVLFNPEYKQVFSDLADVIRPGIAFEDLLRAYPATFDTEGVPFEDWAQRRLEHHRAASGKPFVVHLANGRWILHREFRMPDGGTVGLRTDVTELKCREQEVETLRRRYRLILDSAGEGIVGVNPRGRIIFANSKAGTLLGYSPEAMIDRCFHGLVQPVYPNGEEYPAEESPLGCAYRHGTVGEVTEDTFWREDGSTMPVDYYVAPIDEDGAIAGAVVVFRDATLRLRYERTLADSRRELEHLVAERTRDLTREVEIRARTEGALRESRERLKSVTDSLFEGVLVLNRSGHVSFVNPSARALLNIDGDPEGLPADSVVRLDGTGFADSPWFTVVKDGVAIRDDDAVLVTAEGKPLDVAYACSAIRIEGEVRAAVISFRDITALKQAQRETLQASRMASVGQLAAGIAHEINTPIQYIGDNLRFISESMQTLANVVNAGQHVADGAGAALAAEYAEICEACDVRYLLDEVPNAVSQSLDGVAQVARIVLSMKEFSHPGSSSKTMADINRAIDNTLTVARNTWKHVAEVERDFDPSLPPVPCYVGELNQVFLNLIVNASHAIEDKRRSGLGLIRISTSREGDHVVIRVSDNGGGVPEAIREQIFDPFFTTKDVGKGTGQGLAICRDVVVTKHGGKIEVGGREGEGANFTVRLPLDPACGSQPARVEEVEHE